MPLPAAELERLGRTGDALVVFRSKIDAWLLAVLATALFLPLLQAAAAFREGLNATPHLTISILLGGFFLWLLLSTKYTVNADVLIVQSGPFKWRIKRSEITRIVPSRSIISSPALSLDRLKIDYAQGRKSVLISPKEKDGFLKAIAITSNASPDKTAPNAT